MFYDQNGVFLLHALIVMFCEIGAFSVNNNVSDVLIMNIFGLAGYLMKRYEFEGSPLILALVLGPMFENSLRRALIISDGSPAVFFPRPISAAFLVVALVFIISPLFTRKRIGKEALAIDEED